MAREIRASWRSEVSTEPMLYEGDKDAAQYANGLCLVARITGNYFYCLVAKCINLHIGTKRMYCSCPLNDRTDADGNKVLFIEEIQSDWHQEGRKEGYKSPDADAIAKEFREYSKELAEKYGLNPRHNLAMYKNIKGMTDAEVNKWLELQKRYLETDIGLTKGVPNAPFAKTWHEFVLKRMLRYAAENGYDTVAWTTGEQQANRYHLSKYVSKVRYAKDVVGTYYYDVYDHEGKVIHEAYEASPSDIENF